MSLDIEEMLSEKQEAQDFPLIRLEAATILTPGPWSHRIADWTRPLSCSKCQRQIAKNGIEWLPEYGAPCSLPDLLTDPMEVIAERLVKKVQEADDGVRLLTGAILDNLWEPVRKTTGAAPNLLIHWLRATPAERAACCIEALETEAKS